MFYVNREDITFQHFGSIHSHKVMPLSFLLFCLYRTKFVLQEDISGVIMKIPAVSFRPYFSFLKTLVDGGDQCGCAVCVDIAAQAQDKFIGKYPYFVCRQSVTVQVHGCDSMFPIRCSAYEIGLIA